MKHFVLCIVALLQVLFCTVLLSPALAATSGAAVASSTVYQQQAIHNPDGIGKFYLGREIAQVMGHTGASWLERPSREIEEKPSLIAKALNLKPSDVVADIGAGTGYLAFRIAPFVPLGRVLAVDIQPEMLDIIESWKKERNVANVFTVQGSGTDPNLTDESIDKVLMVDA